MGLMDFLFGGNEQKSTLTEGQARVLDKLAGAVEPNIGVSGPQFPGQTIADPNNIMLGGIRGLAGLGMDSPNYTGAATSVLSGAGDPQGVQAFYESQLAPAREMFRDDINSVAQQYGATYGRTGALPKMVGEATSDFNLGMGGLLGQLVFDDRNAARDRQLQGLVASPAIETGRAMPFERMYDAGSTMRGLEQEQLMDAFSKWQGAQWYNNPALGLLQPLLGTQAVQNVQTPGMLSGITGAIQGGAQAAKGLAGLFQ